MEAKFRKNYCILSECMIEVGAGELRSLTGEETVVNERCSMDERAVSICNNCELYWAVLDD